ncbi:MAG: ComEA family DNA-binding protein [Desulfatiglandales bacterium]
MNWTRSNSKLEVEKGALLLLCLLLLASWLFRIVLKDVQTVRSLKLTPQNPHQSITLGHRVDINEADLEGLMAIPKMTEKMAQRILSFRELHGKIKDEASLREALGNRYRDRLPRVMAHISFGKE